MRIKEHELLFKVIVGSHSYGTNVKGSDVDYKGIYIQTPKSVLYEGYVPQVEINKDETYYEVGRFLALCETANPIALELLYSPEDCVVYKHPIYRMLEENRQLFLTKKCKLSFGGYAFEQIIKAKGLNKKMNWEKERAVRKDILDFCFIRNGCGSMNIKNFLKDLGLKQEQIGLVSLPHMRDCYGVYWDIHKQYEEFHPSGIAKDLLNSNEVSITSIPKSMETGFNANVLMYFNKDAYSRHCREYKEYQTWMKNRNVQRYVDVRNHQQQIDGKNLLHCVRLIETALEIPIDKTINVRRPNADYLIGIRHGQYDLNMIVEKCEKDLVTLNRVFDDCDLPTKVDSTDVKRIVISIREAFENYKKVEQYY